MKLTGILASLIAVLCLFSCADYLPGTGILAPKSIGGYEMDATGFKGSYYFRFAEDGTYRRETIKPSGKKDPNLSGKWTWKRQSPDHAILVLDGKMTIDLQFTTRAHANATLEGDEKLYPVEFTSPQ